MKKILFSIFLLGAVLLTACSDKKGGEAAYGGDPVVTATFPSSGSSGEVIDIQGVNFGEDPGVVRVSFDGTQARIVSFEAGSIHVMLPVNEQWDEERTLFMQISVGERTSRKYAFSFKIRPYLLYLSPSRGLPGDLIEISGRRFDPDKTKNTVLFDGQPVEVISATTETLKVIVPSGGYRKSSSVQVSKAGGYTSNTATFFFDNDKSDTEAIVNASWTEETVSPGVVWKHADFTAFGKQRSVHVVEITPSQVTAIDIAYVQGTRKTTSAMCKQVDAVAGINGGYFNTTGPDDYFRYNGTEVTVGRNPAPDYIDAAIVLEAKDNIRIAGLRPGGNPAAKNLAGKSVMAAGPLLVANGMVIDPFSTTDDHYTLEHPRTAAGIGTGGKVLFVTVDGRQTGKTGLPIRDLSVLMKALGATSAVNLDGGGSTTMYVKGKGSSGLVNSPSDGSERTVSSMIYVK